MASGYSKVSKDTEDPKKGNKYDPVSILLKAEEDAKAIINAARERRDKMLRRLRSESKADLDSYNAKLDAKLQQKIANAQAFQDKAHEELSESAARDIHALKTNAANNESEVESWLVSLALGW